MKIMKNWIEKDGEVIAIFKNKEHTSTFLETITGLRKEKFEDETDFYRAVFKQGYEQYYGEAEINL